MSDSVLIRAIWAAEERKAAVLGEQAPAGVYMATDVPGTRALFSGFDLDHDELGAVAHRAARMFSMIAADAPLSQTFLTCWCDALLVGLYAAQIARTAPLAPDSEGEGDAG